MAKPIRCDLALFDRDLSGKTYIVTGANSGIGFVTTEQLVKQGAHVVMACRRVDVAQEKANEIMSAGVAGTTEVMVMDLGDLSSIRRFAGEFLDRYARLDGLINNAGVMNTKEGQTKDGFETQFGINHLGHFLLTSLLLGVLKSSAPSRIVVLSSCYHDKAVGRVGDIHFDDLHSKIRPYDGWEAYAQSKLANILHARELARRLEGSGVTAVSVHPGWVRTDLIRHSMPVWIQDTLMRPFLTLAGMISPWDGAQTSLNCILNEDIPNHPGAFFSQRGMYRKRSCNKGGWPLISPNPNVNDDNAKRLWIVSAEEVGL